LRTIALSVFAIAAMLPHVTLAERGDALIVSPITALPSGEIHEGALVWVDLLTTDPKKALAFYTAVFDWQSVSYADDTYIELSHDGRIISAIVLYESDDAVDGDARWLVSLSVKDVDAAVKTAVNNGGTVLEPATDLPDRGRYSVISDAQGAVLMLLRATGGDPLDTSPLLDQWDWAELWTDDVESAVSFYEALAGYDTLRFPESASGARIVLGTDGVARTTIVQLPWDDVEPNWIPYIPVADLADTLRRINDAGGEVLVTSDDSDPSFDVAIVMDPTGGVFAVQQAEASQ
jgi:predicted enzyme related to lactoylglutathione lyase